MIIDKQLMLDQGVAVTASAPSTNIIDQGAAGNAYGNELYIVAKTSVAFAGGTSLGVQLQTSDTPNFATSTVLFDSSAIPVAKLTANTEIVKFKMPLGAKQYIRAYYTVVGTMTAGKLDVFFTPDVKI